MAQFTRPGKAAPEKDPAGPGQSPRPRGIALSALALLALLLGSLLGDLLELHRTAPGGEIPGTPPSLELLRIGLSLAIGVLCIWNFRQGRSWARLLVLLWSVAAVARALSFMAEHNLDPAALMGRPLRFFQAVMASILLYWLNTPEVRAWFRKTSAGAGELIGDRLRGKLCTAVELRHELWHLLFEHDSELILGCPWRIVLDDNLVFVTAQDGETWSVNSAARSVFARSPQQTKTAGDPATDQQPPESVPAPSHTLEEARRLLQNLRVTAVRVAPRSSDLVLSFEMGIELQTWSASSPGPGGAPLWKYSDPALTVIAEEAKVYARFSAAPADTASADTWKQADED